MAPTCEKNVQIKLTPKRSNRYRPQFVPTIYHTRGEHANHYATDVVPYFYFLFVIFLIKISYCPSIYYLKTKINPKQLELLDIYINIESSYFCSNILWLRTQHWLGIRIMCPRGATYLPNDCC
jgi:hypothetical protein